MKEFEAMYILKTDMSPEDTEKEVKAVEAIVIGEGGAVIEHSDWGKKRLAYVIAKQRYGQFVLFRFSSPPTTPEKMTRHFRYNENVLKGMILRLDGGTGYNPGAEIDPEAAVEDKTPSWIRAQEEQKEAEEKAAKEAAEKASKAASAEAPPAELAAPATKEQPNVQPE
ncbi:MAG: 30S ribosomal protein S6 [Nitrospinota bacterium]|nr:30S ribosomal protein S6 [Nitrospinota bacterium]